MTMRRLGTSEIAVEPWCLGGNVFGWTADRETSFAILDRFIDLGFNFIDTADVYSRWAPGHVGGESEAIIGQWLRARGCRNRVVLATKVGMEMENGRKGLSRHTITAAVEASLKRLGTEVIDLYQSHRDDPETPQEETLEAYATLIASGKVRVVGASNFNAERLGMALDVSDRTRSPRYQTLQPEYNLFSRTDFESSLQAVCETEGLSVIPYYSLAAGFLTGKYRSEADFAKSPRGAGMQKYLTPRGLRILAALDQVAADCEATPAQVALAWLMNRPTIAAPIASATSVVQVESLAAAARLRLSGDAIRLLDGASRPGD